MPDTRDLFDIEPKRPRRARNDYSAKDIEVLEGLEPVRRRPAMYVGGTDEAALHHLFAEVLDNAMDEAVAGHASRIEVELAADGTLTVRDNGRGIPVDRHPKYKNRSALEIILTTLHAGAKFSDKIYRTAGGLHGVGVSVVNALSETLAVEVARDRKLWTQTYRHGKPTGPIRDCGAVHNRRGTGISFRPDAAIFGDEAAFRPRRVYRMARSKAYLFGGVEIRWSCDPALIGPKDDTPANATLHFPGGLADFLAATVDGQAMATPTPFVGQARFPNDAGSAEWAIAWPLGAQPFLDSYCNTVPTPQGGTHETGLRTALSRSLKAYGELVGNKRAARITADDVTGGACAMLSVFLRDPQFQGQIKEKLVTPGAARLVETTLKDHFDHWLSDDPQAANALLALVVERAEERLRRRRDSEVARKAATRRLRLPGKLADCTRTGSKSTEIFLVEGDSAGGSAKQARNREAQAVLPLRGKILNVASASSEKLRANQELNDLILALGCGVGARYDDNALRYERVIIMTDADVDGAHIAALFMTYFWRELPALIENGHLYLAVPPLYRLSRGGDTAYARDDAHRDALLKERFAGRGKVEISRFKGLGEMRPAQLKETTMDPATRTLLRVAVADDDRERTDRRVENLMGRHPELRFAFIQENAKFVADIDV
ncbi:MAG: DNA topoisomerase IV subunit B [Alphaproteobacteria bacterium]